MNKVVGKRSGKSYPVREENLLGQGAEGRAFRLRRLVVKVYSLPLLEKKVRKTEYLISVGKKMARSGASEAFAWPIELATLPGTGEVVAEIQPFVPGMNLQDVIDGLVPAPRWSDAVKAAFALQLATGVAELHALKAEKIVAGDVIKAANVIIDGDKARFIDVSSASVMALRLPDGRFEEAIETIYTPGYRPKEVLDNPGAKPSHNDDRFALAVLLFELFFGRSPTDCPAVVALHPDEAVRKGIFPWLLNSTEYPEPSYQDVDLPELERMFRSAFLTCHTRPSAEDWARALTELNERLAVHIPRWVRTKRLIAAGVSFGNWLLTLPRPVGIRPLYFLALAICVWWAWKNGLLRHAPPPVPETVVEPFRHPGLDGPSPGPEFFKEFFQ